MKERKRSLSTKTILIIILTVVLLAIATTGVVLFLKDSGQAEAMSEENLTGTLPVAGTDEEQTTEEPTQENPGQTETVAPTEQTGATASTTTEEAITATGGTTTTTGETAITTTAEPEVSTVQREKIIAENLVISWSSIGLVGNLVNNNLGIYYKDFTATKQAELIENNGNTTDGKADVGDVIKYTFSISNIGTLPIDDLILNDSMLGIKDVKISTIKVGEQANIEKQYTVTQEDVNNQKDLINTATLTTAEEEKKIISNSISVNDEFNYTVNYYKDEVKAENYLDKIEGTATFADVITADVTKFIPTGYEFTGTVPTMTIGVDESTNVIDVVYTKITGIGYTVNYYKDEVKAENYLDKIEGTATFADVITADVTKFIPTGYEFTGTVPTMTIGVDESTNVIDVVYTKITGIGYTVNYYKGEVKAENYLDKIEGTATFADVITADVTKFIPTGYEFTGTVPTMTIGVDESTNVIDIVYTPRTDLSYTVNYWYNGVKSKTITVLNQTYGALIKLQDIETDSYKTYQGKDYTVEKITTAQMPEISSVLIISNNLSLNVINVYFVRPEIQSEKTSKAYLANGTLITENKIHEGDTIEYTIKVWNTGLKEETVIITDQAPTGTAYINGDMTKTISIPANTSYENAKTMKFTVKVNAGATGKIGNTAYLDKGPNPTDPTIYDIIKLANITVTKSANKTGDVEPGDIIQYTLNATNDGDEAGKVTMKDTIPAGTTLEGSITATGISTTITAENLESGIEITVLANSSAKIEFSVKVSSSALGTTIKNKALYDGKDTNEITNKVVKTINAKRNVGTITNLGVNYVFVIDTSKSMWDSVNSNDPLSIPLREQENSRLQAAKDAINSFATTLFGSSSNSTITLIQFNSDSEFIGTYSSVNGTASGLKSLDVDLRTNVESGLKLANSTINTIGNTNKNIVILLSDGGISIGYERDGIKLYNSYVKDKNKLYCIGFGPGANSSTDVYKTLDKIDDGSQNSSVYTSTDATGLIENLTQILYETSDPTPVECDKINKVFSLEGKVLDPDKTIKITYEQEGTAKANEYTLTQIQAMPNETPLIYNATEHTLTFNLTNYLQYENIVIEYFVK